MSALTGKSSKTTAKGVKLLAQGMASCSAEATMYGRCIAAKYQDAHKDMCAKEFDAFKQCVQRAVKRKW
ncbi:hypothetical protein BX666DRAFT_1918998 [Dichotomocladium elegans]|nr:hypothetical protein BX666DRAFT_1918998 [Dichotomocladium elegans]